MPPSCGTQRNSRRGARAKVCRSSSGSCWSDISRAPRTASATETARAGFSSCSTARGRPFPMLGAGRSPMRRADESVLGSGHAADSVSTAIVDVCASIPYDVTPGENITPVMGILPLASRISDPCFLLFPVLTITSLFTGM